MPESGIARVTKQAADSLCDMAVVDVQSQALPVRWTTADLTQPALRLKHDVKVGLRQAVASERLLSISGCREFRVF